jgi:hypothetical protein
MQGASHVGFLAVASDSAALGARLITTPGLSTDLKSASRSSSQPARAALPIA